MAAIKPTVHLRNQTRNLLVTAVAMKYPLVVKCSLVTKNFPLAEHLQRVAVVVVVALVVDHQQNLRLVILPALVADLQRVVAAADLRLSPLEEFEVATAAD